MSDHFNALVKIRVANSRFADEWLSDSVAGFRALCRDATPATNNNCAKFRGLGRHNKPPKHWVPYTLRSMLLLHREPHCGCLAPIVVPASVEGCVPDANVATAMMWRRTRRSLARWPIAARMRDMRWALLSGTSVGTAAVVAYVDGIGGPRDL